MTAMQTFSQVKQLQELNQVISQDFQLGNDMFPQFQTESPVIPVSLPILIPYQSKVILNQTLVRKIIERCVRGYIEWQQQIAQKESLSRDHLQGLIGLSYWEPELSDIQLSLVMQEIGRIIRDSGELPQEQYKELNDGNIVFEINDYSQFIEKLAVNRVGMKIQRRIDIIQTFIKNYFQRDARASNTSLSTLLKTETQWQD